MNAREFAYEALQAIMLKKEYSNLYLRNHLQVVSANEQALATQIVYGTLQNARFVRSLWMPLVKKEPKPELQVLLDMSMYQLWKLDSLPSYAIVDESVTLSKKKSDAYGSFVNGVLRSYLRNPYVERECTTIEDVALRTSHPLWVVKMWAKQYGEETAKNICWSNLEEKPLCVRVQENQMHVEDMKNYPEFEKTKLSPIGFIYKGKDLFHHPLFLENKIVIQDEASQMVAFGLDAKENEYIFDMCAAPGTKTTQIAAMMQDNGKIIASDIHEHRVQLINNLVDKLNLTCVQTSVQDSRNTTFEDETFDRVLCDVPCSGYGVLGRKSDIKFHMQQEDMDTLIPLQYEILQEGYRVLKKNGILIYSTCTLNKKENEKQIEKLQKETGVTLIKETTIFPFSYNCDGFYIAVLQKDENMVK